MSSILQSNMIVIPHTSEAFLICNMKAFNAEISIQDASRFSLEVSIAD